MRAWSILARLYPRNKQPSSAALGFLKRSYGLTRPRWLHSSLPKPALPIPHLATPGPPPERALSELEHRLERKRRQAELLQIGQKSARGSARTAGAFQKRFWKDVSIEEKADGFQVLLDGRPVRTTSKRVLTVPLSKKGLALAIALEWDLLVSAQQALKHHYIPLTSLTARAIDIQSNDASGGGTIRREVVATMMDYLRTDTLLCWAPENNPHDPRVQSDAEPRRKSLRNLQMRVAKSIVSYLTTNVWPGLEIRPALSADSILPSAQPPMTEEVIRGWVFGLPAFELAGLERAALASKSLLVAARLLVEWSQHFADVPQRSEQDARFGIEEAAEACSLEVQWQTGMWGEVEDTHDVEKEDLRRQLGSVIILSGGM